GSWDKRYGDHGVEAPELVEPAREDVLGRTTQLAGVGQPAAHPSHDARVRESDHCHVRDPVDVGESQLLARVGQGARVDRGPGAAELVRAVAVEAVYELVLMRLGYRCAEITDPLTQVSWLEAEELPGGEWRSDHACAGAPHRLDAADREACCPAEPDDAQDGAEDRQSGLGPGSFA